jgi:ATP-binding cassette subfamily C protein
MLAHLREVLRLLDPGERLTLAGVGLIIMANSLLEVVGVAMVLPFIALVNDSEAIHRYPLLEKLFAVSGIADPAYFLAACGGGFVLLIVVKNALYLLGIDVQNRFVMENAGRKAGAILGRIVHQPLLELRAVNSAEHFTTVNYSVENLYVAVILGFASALTEAVTIAGIATLLVVVEPRVTVAVGVVLGGAMILLHKGLGRWFTYFGRVNNEYYEKRLNLLRHICDAAKEIKLLGCEETFVAEYSRVRGANARLMRLNADFMQLPRVLIETLVVAGIVAIVVAALLAGSDRQQVTATLGVFAVAAFRLMPSANRLAMALGNIRMGEDTTRRVATAMRSSAITPPAAAGPVAPLPFAERITLDGLGFAYDPNRFALSGVSFTIGRGEAVGLIGPTGSGKSTLMDILLGLLPPKEGRILVDGVDIATDLRGWQANIGYVPQTICLIDDSVRRNVAFGLPDAEIDDARVWEALHLARIDGVVRALPKGLDTMLGEDGHSLSGGQRQRIGLARALYRDPPMLCMDEATSALDSETEHEITEALAGLQGRKTMLIIAHRLSTVKNCDRLVMMQDGRVHAAGTFADLLDREPAFRRTVQLGNVSGAEGS